MNATTPRARLIRQTHLAEAGAIVATWRQDACTYETRVEGGRLDAWTLPASSRDEAMEQHDGAVRLVGQAARE